MTNLKTLSTALLFSLSASSHAVNIAQGLNVQAEAAKDSPINQMQVLGAHNAWNDGSNPWNNQRWSLDTLMDKGIRNIDLDLHLDGNEVKLCHQNCGAVYAAKDSYPNELQKIKNWVNNNPQSIVFVDLEDRVHEQNGVEAPLYSVFGDLLYRPSDKPAGRWETPREMIAKGKRVIVKSANDTYDGSLIFSDNDFAVGASGGWNSRQVKYFDGNNCTVNGSPIDTDLIYTLSDSKLGKDWLPDGWVDQTGNIDSGNIPKMMKCGIDIVDADRWDDSMVSATIWSWGEGEPNNSGNEDCASIRADGRWNDLSCDAQLPAVCQNDTDANDWRMTLATSNWSGAAALCQSEYSGYHFSAPANGYSNQQLLTETQGNQAWLALSDQGQEGQWELYNQPTTSWTTGAYANNEDRAQTLRVPGATAISLSLSGHTQSGADKVYVYDADHHLQKTLSGAISTTLVLNSNAAIVRLVSNGLVTDSGITASVQSLVTEWTTGAYSNNENRSQYLAVPNASALKVSISGATESGYDFITILDKQGNQIKRLSGNLSNSFIVSGNGITATLTSDGSVTAVGVTVSVKSAPAYVFRTLVDGKGKCLDLEGGSTSNGTAIHHWSCQGQVTQLWYMGPDGLIRNKKNTNKCVDVSGGGTSNGSKIHIWDCHGGTNQQWHWSGTSLRPASAPDKAIDIKDAWWGSYNGQNVHLWKYQGSWGQNWHWK